VPAVLLAMGAIVALHGRGIVAAARTSNRVVVHVRGVSGPAIRNAGLVVPLQQRGPTQGELRMLDRKGQPAGECPLTHTDVSADVSGFVARVTVTQQFHNPSNEPIEAVYTFPLPSDAAVDDMDMRIGNRVVKGEIKRKEEARAVYEAAKAAGQATALLDQERPNIFTQSVANIMPGEDVRITIKYVNTLKYDEGRYEFVFPMVVGPRFVPGGGYTVPGKRGAPSPQRQTGRDVGKQAVVTDADKITPPITPPGTRAGHDISVSVNLDAGVELGEITSVMHDIDVARDGKNRAEINLSNQASIPNKDFILRFTVAGGAIQTGLLTHANGNNDGYFTLILQPPAAPPQSKISEKEIVFVIDQTGSQMGTPIEMSKTAMKYAIRHLNPGDTFQLVGFNTSVYPCFEKAVPATPDNIAKAIAYLDPLEGAGGTDILKAADYALSMPVDPSRLRIICFMTDGYVGNDMQIIDYVKTHRGQARMFPFGIGSSVNRFLIEGMAREGRGQSDIIALNEGPTAASEKFYRRIASPVLLDPQVDWGGLPVQEVFPQQIPDVFSYGPIILKGRYTHAAEGDITVRGLVRGKPWQETIHVSLPPLQPNGGGIESLWAREKIDDLQSQDWIGAQTGSPIQNIKDQIIDVALAHRLMSQYTSFVAVEQRVVNVGGRQRTVDVPVEMPEGVSYDGIFGEAKDKSALTAGTLYATGSNQYNLNFNYRNAPASTGAFGMSKLSPAVPQQSLSRGTVGGGFGGAVAAIPTPAAPPMPGGPPMPAVRLAPPAKPPVRSRLTLSESPAHAAVSTNGSLAGEELAFKSDALKAMKPADRMALLENVKMHTALHGLAAKVKAEGKNGTLHTPSVQVDNGRVWVQVWVKSASKANLAKLKAAGFTLETTLMPGKLLLGSVPVAKLESIAALVFVARIEPVILK
jgi:Ca-activated chloride channel family protein